MVDVNKAIVVKLRTHGNVFEILADCEKALQFKKGKNIPISDIVATNEIYKDVKKGERASENELKKIFNTADTIKIAETIIIKGEIPLTAEHMSKEREKKFNQIVELIHKNAVDAKTGLPHPIQRIKDTIEQGKIKIEEHKTAEQQVERVIGDLTPLLPIKIEIKIMDIKIPSNFAGKSYSSLKKYGKILKDEWLNDGSLKARVEIPGGLQDDFFSELNNLTHGNVEIKIEKQE